jgi:hypothetical protein
MNSKFAGLFGRHAEDDSAPRPDTGPLAGYNMSLTRPARTHPSKPIGQAAVDDPPDTAPVAEKLKAWRKK